MVTQRPIEVLVVDDSPVSRELLVHILGSDPRLHVMATATNGVDALDVLTRRQPDVITMDLQMPKMDGYEATRRIMETKPLPIVVVSASWSPEQADSTFRILEAGAVGMVEKPRGIGHPDYEEIARKITQTVRSMAEVKVIKRWARNRYPASADPASAGAAAVAPPAAAATLGPSPAPAPANVSGRARAEIKIVAIGASTGGPPVLATILEKLPKDFPLPILIVQHIAAGFLTGFVAWLEHTAALPLHIPEPGEPLQPGHVYLAPDARHLGVDRAARIVLSGDPPESGLRPAVSYLFRSVSAVYGRNAAGVLLTGMGRDGADELKLMRDRGALTIAQDQETSVVHGMPGEAIKLGAAMHVLPPERIAATLAALVR